MNRMAVVSAAISVALVSLADPALSTTGTPEYSWIVGGSVSSCISYGTGHLLSRDSLNGSIHTDAEEIKATVGLSLARRISPYFSAQLEYSFGTSHFGGSEQFVVGDSASVGWVNLCRGTVNTALLSIEWRIRSEANKRYFKKGFFSYWAMGPVVGVEWLTGVTLDESGAAAVGVASVDTNPGMIWGGTLEWGVGTSTSRWLVGLRGAIFGGGAMVKYETLTTSAWEGGESRVRLLPLGIFLSYML